MLPIYRLNAIRPSWAAPTLVSASLRPSVMPLGPRSIPHAGANPTARYASPFDLFMTRAEATALHGALRPRPPAGPPSARGRGARPPGAWPSKVSTYRPYAYGASSVSRPSNRAPVTVNKLAFRYLTP